MLKRLGIQRNSLGGCHSYFPQAPFFILSACYIELLEEVHIYITKSGPRFRVTTRINIKETVEQLISYHVYFSLIGSGNMSGY